MLAVGAGKKQVEDEEDSSKFHGVLDAVRSIHASSGFVGFFHGE
jgi:hypothetical protein